MIQCMDVKQMLPTALPLPMSYALVSAVSWDATKNTVRVDLPVPAVSEPVCRLNATAAGLPPVCIWSASLGRFLYFEMV